MKKAPDVLDEKSLRQMIESNADEFAELNAALIATAAIWGTKAIEASSITVGDILDRDGRLKKKWVLRKEISFNNFQRVLYTVHESLVKYLDAYLDWRVANKIGVTNIGEYRGLDPEERLFLNPKGEEFAKTKRGGDSKNYIPSGFNAYFAKLIRNSNIPGVTYKEFRRSLAIRMFREGAEKTNVKKGIMDYLGIRSYDALMNILNTDTLKLESMMKGIYKRL